MYNKNQKVYSFYFKFSQQMHSVYRSLKGLVLYPGFIHNLLPFTVRLQTGLRNREGEVERRVTVHFTSRQILYDLVKVRKERKVLKKS